MLSFLRSEIIIKKYHKNLIEHMSSKPKIPWRNMNSESLIMARFKLHKLFITFFEKDLC